MWVGLGACVAECPGKRVASPERKVLLDHESREGKLSQVGKIKVERGVDAGRGGNLGAGHQGQWEKLHMVCGTLRVKDCVAEPVIDGSVV
jgi:hypothetical protein